MTIAGAKLRKFGEKSNAETGSLFAGFANPKNSIRHRKNHVLCRKKYIRHRKNYIRPFFECMQYGVNQRAMAKFQ